MSFWWSAWASESSRRTGRSRLPEGTSRRARASLAAGALLGAACLAAPSGLPAQQAREVDAGEFRIVTENAPRATENFAIRREGETYQSVARLTGDAEGASLGTGSIQEFRLQLDANLRPTFFELAARGGEARGVVGVRAGNRIQLRGRSPEGETWKELLLDPGLVVLPEGLAHPYYFVVQALQEGSDRPLPVVAPEAGERRSLTVEGRSRETVTVNDTGLPAIRHDLRIEGQLHRVWADEEGRILRVEIPGRSWTATRSEPPAAR